jgi:hypothetical protein
VTGGQVPARVDCIVRQGQSPIDSRDKAFLAGGAPDAYLDLQESEKGKCLPFVMEIEKEHSECLI